MAQRFSTDRSAPRRFIPGWSYPALSQDDKQRILDLYDQGFSTETIAMMAHGRWGTGGRVRHILRQLGREVRSRSVALMARWDLARAYRLQPGEPFPDME